MTASIPTSLSVFTPRQRDRRLGFGDVLQSLTRTLDGRGDPFQLRCALEDSLRRVVPVRSVHLRDAGSRWSARADTTGVEAIVLEVPAADGSSAGVLEATFDPGCPLGEWDFQVLGLAVHIAGLVLEIERVRGVWLVAAWHFSRPDPDATAPRR